MAQAEIWHWVWCSCSLKKKHIGSLIVQSGQWKVCQGLSSLRRRNKTEQWLKQREFSTEAAGHSPCSRGSQNGYHILLGMSHWSSPSPGLDPAAPEQTQKSPYTSQHLQGRVTPYHAVILSVSTTLGVGWGRERIPKHLFPSALLAAPFGTLS